jgi:hypothetical protein
MRQFCFGASSFFRGADIKGRSRKDNRKFFAAGLYTCAFLSYVD